MPVIFKLASGENVPLDGGFPDIYIFYVCTPGRICVEREILRKDQVPAFHLSVILQMMFMSIAQGN